jgi:hypothetical protein
MNIGDRIKVIDLVWSPKNYPFLPNLLGWTGIIVEELCPLKGDEPAVYKVKFDNKFKIGILPPDITAFGYKPIEWEERDTHVFTSYEIQKICLNFSEK